MTDTTDPRVDASINKLPDWQQAIWHQVRELVRAAERARATPAQSPRTCSKPPLQLCPVSHDTAVVTAVRTAG